MQKKALNAAVLEAIGLSKGFTLALPSAVRCAGEPLESTTKDRLVLSEPEIGVWAARERSLGELTTIDRPVPFAPGAGGWEVGGQGLCGEPVRLFDPKGRLGDSAGQAR